MGRPSRCIGKGEAEQLFLRKGKLRVHGVDAEISRADTGRAEIADFFSCRSQRKRENLNRIKGIGSRIGKDKDSLGLSGCAVAHINKKIVSVKGAFCQTGVAGKISIHTGGFQVHGKAVNGFVVGVFTADFIFLKTCERVPAFCLEGRKGFFCIKLQTGGRACMQPFDVKIRFTVGRTGERKCQLCLGLKGIKGISLLKERGTAGNLKNREMYRENEALFQGSLREFLPEEDPAEEPADAAGEKAHHTVHV